MECISGSRAFALGVVILAAGRSRRMGRPKLLLPWGGLSVLGHLIRQWQGLGPKQIVVVCASDDPLIEAELDRVNFSIANRIHNPTPERGMFSSIQCAAAWPRWKRGLAHWAIVLGDQPHLRHETLRALLEFGAAHPEKICLPCHGGHRRHPVVLPRAVFEQLADSRGRNLKKFLNSRAKEVLYCELNDPGLALDLDTPGDYEKALRIYFGTTDGK